MYSGLKQFALIILASTVLVGCSNLPYERTTETGVAGAAAGAAVGAVVAGDEDEMLGALLGGVLGAAAGYVIGAETGWFSSGNEAELNDTVDEAITDPATVEDVYGSNDADLNNDGLVTRDELIAMSNAGLGEQAIIDRLAATNQVFHVTAQQRQTLIEAGVDPDVVYALDDINRARETVL